MPQTKIKFPHHRLLISFSGGRTSGYMTWWVLNNWKEIKEYDVKVVFANTGKEQEATLRFVESVSVRFGIKIIWVEAVPIQSKRGGWWQVGHKVVNYETASRDGEPFELMISKLGIPNQAAPFCSDQLKRLPIESYLKSVGWKKYYKAIGIRADEVDRMNPKFREKKIVYPLIKNNPVNKKMVNDWWALQEFNLEIDDDLGNCDGCWKKAMSRLVRIAQNHPQVFDWWQEMTDRYIDLRPRSGSQKATITIFIAETYRRNKSLNWWRKKIVNWKMLFAKRN